MRIRNIGLSVVACLALSLALSPPAYAYTITDLGTLGGGKGSEASAVNDQGWVIGTSVNQSNMQHGFLWQGGMMNDLGALSNPGWSYSHAINNSGQVVGESWAGAGGHAFLWQNGAMKDLGTLNGSASIGTSVNDRGQVVGASTPGGFSGPGGYP